MCWEYENETIAVNSSLIFLVAETIRRHRYQDSIVFPANLLKYFTILIQREMISIIILNIGKFTVLEQSCILRQLI